MLEARPHGHACPEGSPCLSCERVVSVPAYAACRTAVHQPSGCWTSPPLALTSIGRKLTLPAPTPYHRTLAQSPSPESAISCRWRSPRRPSASAAALITWEGGGGGWGGRQHARIAYFLLSHQGEPRGCRTRILPTHPPNRPPARPHPAAPRTSPMPPRTHLPLKLGLLPRLLLQPRCQAVQVASARAQCHQLLQLVACTGSRRRRARVRGWVEQAARHALMVGSSPAASGARVSTVARNVLPARSAFMPTLQR